jgi:DNA-binding NtrC family response regulator
VDPRFVEMLLHLPLGSNVRELGKRLWEGMATSPGDVVRAPPAVEVAAAKQARAPGPTETTRSETDAADGAYTVEQVLACLERERWRMAETAAALGLRDRHALTRLLKRMGIENPRRMTEKKRRTGS